MQVTITQTAAAAASAIGSICAPTTVKWAAQYGAPFSGKSMSLVHPVTGLPVRTGYALVQLGHGASPTGNDIKVATKTATLADGTAVTGVWIAHHKVATLGGALWASNGIVYTFAPAPTGSPAGSLVQHVGDCGVAPTFADAIGLLVAENGPWNAAKAAAGRLAIRQAAASAAAAKMAETAPAADPVAPAVAAAETAPAVAAESKPVKAKRGQKQAA
jgi:hypothetical protein